MTNSHSKAMNNSYVFEFASCYKYLTLKLLSRDRFWMSFSILAHLSCRFNWAFLITYSVSSVWVSIHLSICLFVYFSLFNFSFRITLPIQTKLGIIGKKKSFMTMAWTFWKKKYFSCSRHIRPAIST